MNIQSVKLNESFGKTPQEIYYEAAQYTNEESKNLPSTKIKDALFPASVAAYIAAKAAAQQGNLSHKLRAGGAEAGFWGILGLSLMGLNKISDEIAKNNKNYKDFKEQQPVLHFIASIVALFGTSMLAVAGLRKGKQIFANKMPELAGKIAKGVDNVSGKIDNSKLGASAENLKDKYWDFVVKHPKAFRFVRSNPMLAIFLAWLAGTIGMDFVNKNDRENMFNNKVQELAQKEIANRYYV